VRPGIAAFFRCPCATTAAIDVKEKRDMRLTKHLLVGGAVAIAMAATTAVALGATHTTTGAAAGGTHSAGARVAVANTALGRVLVDGRGRTLYLFGKDTHGRSACSGKCAGFWPPLITSGKTLATAGAKASLLGTTKRADGRLQVTYNHHPLYTFVKDTGKGQTNGEELDVFGAEWYAVSAAGGKVEKSGSTTSSSGGYPTPGGGGGGY
jgi:predicted lipoprotein with Yx(FWY)xxD motif